MTRFLLDVNAAIALIDPLHVHHDRAHAWFERHADGGWHTCPIVQNGVIRVVSHPKYANAQPTPVAVSTLASLAAHPAHSLLADSVSLLDPEIDRSRLISSGQVTDTYLLLLASRNGARLATFEARMALNALPGADTVIALIP